MHPGGKHHAANLEQKKIRYINTREPGASSMGNELREILLNPNTNISSEVELLLMLADRKDHVEKTILPNLLNDTWVISDRFMDSSIAYQGGGRQLDLSMINSLATYLNLPTPDSTLLFDLPVEIALERTKKRGKLDRFEKEEIEKDPKKAFLSYSEKFKNIAYLNDFHKNREKIVQNNSKF